LDIIEKFITTKSKIKNTIPEILMKKYGYIIEQAIKTEIEEIEIEEIEIEEIEIEEIKTEEIKTEEIETEEQIMNNFNIKLNILLDNLKIKGILNVEEPVEMKLFKVLEDNIKNDENHKWSEWILT